MCVVVVRGGSGGVDGGVSCPSGVTFSTSGLFYFDPILMSCVALILNWRAGHYFLIGPLSCCSPEVFALLL